MAAKQRAFADTLKTLREGRGLSQRALGKLCGLSGQAVSLLELGESIPTWPTVQLLSAALGVDCEALRDDGIIPPEITPEDMPKKPGRPKKPEPAEEPTAAPPKQARKKKG